MRWQRQVRCYVSRAGRNKIADWYAGLSTQEQADADRFIGTQRKVRLWEMPTYKRLGGGIGELRWESEDKQQRLLGFFQDDIWYALIGCTHKQRIYRPPDCLDTARKRIREIQNDEVTTIEYDL